MQNSYRQQEEYKRIQEESMRLQRKMQEANTTQDGICAPNEYFDTETSWCTLCSDKFTNCWSCDETACHSCIHYPAHLEPDGCTRCSANCISCNKTSCVECQVSNYLNSDGKCTYCNSDYCIRCNDTSCLQCYENAYLDSYGQCSYCYLKFPNCNKCDESACNACYDGFFLDYSNNCILCTLPYCNSCDMSNCFSCWSGYYLDSAYKCRQCSDKNCLQCKNDICSSCKPNCYLDSSNTCNKCSSNCIYCDENSCLGCMNGFFLDSDGTCTVCSAKFSKYCDYCDKDSCINCIWGYVPNSDGVCVKCSDLYEGCVVCDKFNCIYCDTMYYMDLNKNCSHCSSGCLKCLNSTACLNCINGDFPFSNGTCNCNGNGVYMDSLTNACEVCSEGCGVCSSSTTCKTCRSPNMINNGDGTCSCRSGYYNGEGHCNSCSNYECTSCENVWHSKNPYNPYLNEYCFSCRDGFYLFNHQCNSCPSGCAECNSQSCLKCFSPDTMIQNVITGECFCYPGYRFAHQSNSCVACLHGCAECDVLYLPYDNNHYICNACFDAEYMINNWDGTCSCVSQMVFNLATHRCDYSTSHCAEHGSLGCYKCDQGYFLHDNSGVLECLSCSESCNSCTPHPGCYLCGNTVEKGSSTCTSDNSVGYLTRFDNGNLILDFAYDLPEPLSINEIIIKSPGVYDTSSWYLTQVTSRQYMIVTNLKSSDLPIDVKFKFNRG